MKLRFAIITLVLSMGLVACINKSVILNPCETPVIEKGSNEKRNVKSFQMGKKAGTATLDIDVYSIEDYVTIYDGVGTSGKVIYPKKRLQYQHTIPFNFTKGAITIVIESDDTSSWEYVVHCPK